MLWALGGCYHHVIREEGAGGEYQIYEPNLKEDKKPNTSTNPYNRTVPTKES